MHTSLPYMNIVPCIDQMLQAQVKVQDRGTDKEMDKPRSPPGHLNWGIKVKGYANQQKASVPHIDLYSENFLDKNF